MSDQKTLIEDLICYGSRYDLESCSFAHAVRGGKVLFRKEEVQILEEAIRKDAEDLAKVNEENSHMIKALAREGIPELTFDDYQTKAWSTNIYPNEHMAACLVAGLCSEAGEVRAAIYDLLNPRRG